MNERMSVMEITKNTIIGDILDADFEVAPYFLEMGMHCLGCPASRGESIEEACAVHGTNPDELVAKLNEHFAKKHKIRLVYRIIHSVSFPARLIFDWR